MAEAVSGWAALAREKQARYESPHGRLDERALVRQGNTAYAAGLCLRMAGSAGCAAWFLRAADAWRASWDLGSATDAWGRPVGALKAALLAGDEQAIETHATWTLGLRPLDRASPIGRYAGVLALLASDGDATAAARPLQRRDDFPADVADALAAVADGDEHALGPAVESVVRSFERRVQHLEDVPVADTALVLQVLARRRGLACVLPRSGLLPSS
jgi:hypothetical protein